MSARESWHLLDDFFAGRIEALYLDRDGCVVADAPKPDALLPGAFNPVHAGHWQLAGVAQRLLGSEVAFELSILNVDKPPLEPEEVRRRLAQFERQAPLWLTRAARFVDKARRFPGSVFVVGADTAARILAPRYYDQEGAGLAEALELYRGQGCCFLVAGRVERSGRFVALEDLAIPATARALFRTIPPDVFRVDLSSTELRNSSRAP